MDASRRNTIYGNDVYREITLPSASHRFKVTYWSLWIALILDVQFGGNWDQLIEHLRAKRQEHYQRDEVEGVLNHVRLLRQALAGEGLTVGDILSGADPAFLKAQARTARRKILEIQFEYTEKSPWMIETPRKQREERAMRGYWSHFPVSPDEYAHLLERQYKSSGYYSEGESFGLERKLSRFLEKHERDASLAQLFALYRAFLTWSTTRSASSVNCTGRCSMSTSGWIGVRSTCCQLSSSRT
jgi:hypothetical protein